jgi:hypothetical protein
MGSADRSQIGFRTELSILAKTYCRSVLVGTIALSKNRRYGTALYGLYGSIISLLQLELYITQDSSRLRYLV